MGKLSGTSFVKEMRSERGGVMGREIMALSVCLSVCLNGFTQGTLYTTTTVYGVLVHQEGAICTTKV